MTRKPHQIIWHKKKNKFMASACLKPHSPDGTSGPGPEPEKAKTDKHKVFFEQLSSEIKKAVR